MDDDTFPENDESDESDEQTSETRKKKKKSGAKGNWNSHTVDNLVDIIANDEYFKDRLIFRNT